MYSLSLSLADNVIYMQFCVCNKVFESLFDHDKTMIYTFTCVCVCVLKGGVVQESQADKLIREIRKELGSIE